MNPAHDSNTHRPRWKKTDGQMQWTNVDAAKMKLAIVAVTSSGGYIQFNQTRDESSLIVKGKVGLSEFCEYPSTTAEADSVLEWLASTFS